MVVVKDGKAVTTTREIAATFEKGHKEVLRTVQHLECSTEFNQRNFAPSFYEIPTGNGAMRQYPMYYVTRDGFAFLAMGFTGKKAAQFKERYIAAFNAMEKKLMGDMREMLSKEDGMKMSDPAEENSPTLAQKLTSIKVSKV